MKPYSGQQHISNFSRRYKLWQLLLLTFAVPLLIALMLLPARALATTTDVAMLQLLWVTWVAQYAGQRWAIICTVNSVLLLNFMFVEPYYTLFVHQGDYLITFIVMLLLGIFIGRISGRLRLELARAKKHMRQRQLLSGKTRQAKMQAELEHSRAMMLRSISHDLRTPLATIMGASSMLADQDLPLSEAQIREQANNIYRQSTLLSQHFDKVMELSRVQQPQSSMQLEPVALTEVISAAIARRAALDGAGHLVARTDAGRALRGAPLQRGPHAGSLGGAHPPGAGRQGAVTPRRAAAEQQHDQYPAWSGLAGPQRGAPGP